MNKADLIGQIFAEQSATISKTQAARMLESIISGITSALKRGMRVTISGFGTFYASKREARAGRNPHTGEAISLPVRAVVRFRPGRELHYDLNAQRTDAPVRIHQGDSIHTRRSSPLGDGRKLTGRSSESLRIHVDRIPVRVYVKGCSKAQYIDLLRAIGRLVDSIGCKSPDRSIH